MQLGTLLYFVAYFGIGAAIIYVLVLFTKTLEILKDINNNLRNIDSKIDKDRDI